MHQQTVGFIDGDEVVVPVDDFEFVDG